MIVTLTFSGTTLTLPADLYWSDEHTYTPVEQSVATSITGATLVDLGARVAQRPITLAGEEDHAWLPFSTVLTLKNWASIPGRQMVLNIRGVQYQVLFRHQDTPALDLTAVVDYATPDATDWFYGQLKFMEV